MNEVITIAGWNPWPLLLPIVVFVAASVAIITGKRRVWQRQIGFVLAVAAAVAIPMTWVASSGAWDTEQRLAAFTDAGYSDVHFGASTRMADTELPDITFTATRDGAEVSGELRHLGEDQWAILELEATVLRE
ncbi:hypothetical protein ACFVAJ_16890 [Agromyces sp. NPDC057679]|uniref:hypothetical protein n=1 Tax=Agromyces sp. NPDC057679 TaxID=3346207 RepID=UPI00366B948B